MLKKRIVVAFAAMVLASLLASLPDGRVVVLPGEGHIAHRTAPELFEREVVRFLVHG